MVNCVSAVHEEEFNDLATGTKAGQNMANCQFKCWLLALIWLNLSGLCAKVTRATCSVCCHRCGAERASDASHPGRVQPHGGLRAAARRTHHQPVLLGLSHGREEKPTVSGTQQHCALHRPLAHQSRLHDLQRWLQGPLLVPPHHHRLRPNLVACFHPCCISCHASVTVSLTFGLFHFDFDFICSRICGRVLWK